MKNEYIRKQDAFDAVEARITELMTHPEFRRKHLDIDLSGVIRNISAIKPADVAKIIRCENCQYHSYDEVFCCYWCEHEGMAREVKPDFYCGYGEE